MSHGVVGLRRGRWWALVFVLLAGCSGAASDPSMEWTSFERADCPSGSGAASCYVLQAEVRGTQAGTGGCEVVAVDTDGATMFDGATIGPLSLAPGRTFEWLVELPDVDDPTFDRWSPRCDATS